MEAQVNKKIVVVTFYSIYTHLKALKYRQFHLWAAVTNICLFIKYQL